MIRKCVESDLDEIFEVINDGAQAYKGVIPEDRWHEPYMPKAELQKQLDENVEFWGLVENGRLAGVMGTQDVGDVVLIRHAYVRTDSQHRGLGSKLLGDLRAKSTKPYLIGTWADAWWAVRFYEKQGFRLVPSAEIPALLREYWSIPERQVETSVVLGDTKWFESGLSKGI